MIVDDFPAIASRLAEIEHKPKTFLKAGHRAVDPLILATDEALRLIDAYDALHVKR